MSGKGWLMGIAKKDFIAVDLAFYLADESKIYGFNYALRALPKDISIPHFMAAE